MNSIMVHDILRNNLERRIYTSDYRRAGSLYNKIRIVETGEIFDTAKDCAKYLDRSPSAISLCLRGINATCAGYHLELIDVDEDDIYLTDLFKGNIEKVRNAPGYFISDLGIAYGPGSLGHRGYHRLSQYSNDEYGHQVVDLYVNGKRHHRYLAVLVAEAFIPNPNNYPEVRHKDGNPYNNHVSNLEWGTHGDNMHDAIRHGTFHYFTPEEDEMSLRVLRKPVKAINIETGKEYNFPSLAEAARTLGVYQSNITHVLSGFYKQTGGFRFEYLDKAKFDSKYYKKRRIK